MVSGHSKVGEVELQPASVGRIVHYIAPPTQEVPQRCRAAVITDVYGEGFTHPDEGIVAGVPGSEWVRVTLFAERMDMDVCHDETTRLPRTWHWPERV
jgi:hypothetical protein